MNKKILPLFVFLVSIGQLAAQNLDSGLVRDYPFDGNANDISSSGDNATVNGPSLTTDRFGRADHAYEFDGIDDIITFSANGLENENFTFSIWCRIDGDIPGNDAYGLIFIGDVSRNDHGITTGEPVNGWTTGSYHTTNTISNVLSGVSPTVNEWHHLVFTRDDANIKLYLNGALIGTTSVAGKTASYANNPIGILGDRGDQSMLHKGKLDDVKVYDRAITPAEITLLYQENPLSSPEVSAFDVTPYPNPVKSGKTVEVSLTANDNLTLELVSIDGKVLRISDNKSISTLGISKGTYILRIRSNEATAVRKIIVN